MFNPFAMTIPVTVRRDAAQVTAHTVPRRPMLRKILALFERAGYGVPWI